MNNTLNFSLDLKEKECITRVGIKDDLPAKYVVAINNPKVYDDFIQFGNLGLGEAYMHRAFTMLHGNLEDLIESMLRCKIDKQLKKNWKWLLKVLPFRMKGKSNRQHKNVQTHYDAGIDIFKSFLDVTLTYSCGYVESEEDSLEQLQQNKFSRICKKLELQRGDQLLDIGCGFGGLLIFAVKQYGIQGTGITNSIDHFELGNQLIRQQHLEDQIKIELLDFKKIPGQFDKIISIGMLEHVPRSDYKQYFSTIHKKLKKGGRGLIHFIGANTHTNEHDFFIQKYIFPDSNQPKLSEITHQLEVQDLAIVDIENMIRHYGYTAQYWLDRFKSNRYTLHAYTDSYLNMFEYYLTCTVAAAKTSDAALYQILFMKDYTLPIRLKRI
ncbi:MAG: class I SAM-dependent methyltransferase [Saprospiraceae bacterium]